jgi:hypothetical protein
MKRIIITVAATLLAVVPATIGLIGNTSFAQSVGVRVPAQATVVSNLATQSTHVEPGDDKGGQVKHVETGHVKSGQVKHVETSHVESGQSTHVETGHGQSGPSTHVETGDNKSGQVTHVDDKGGQVTRVQPSQPEVKSSSSVKKVSTGGHGAVSGGKSSKAEGSGHS